MEAAKDAPADGSAYLSGIRRHLTSIIDKGALELPVLPGVAAEVLSRSLDDHSDAARLAQLIQQDQSLASHVLRIVNSPLFRGATEIVALRQAIARLGMERIREIALSASLSGAVFKQPDYQPLVDRAWQLALCAGLWSKEVARACRRNVEIAYLCGLLHNVGVPLVLSALAGVAKQPLRGADAQTLVDEFATRAGALLGRNWKLPDAVVTTIEHIGRFDGAPDHVEAVAIANAGRGIANAMLPGPLLAADVSKLEAIQYLNLYPDDVSTLLQARDSVRQSMESMSS
ncbi:MAG: HDOD domain-containing protein [Gammaproteobacteria bacterium]|nr:HDOD domain-containing protein [Gammaproteobacteria bacterium]